MPKAPKINYLCATFSFRFTKTDSVQLGQAGRPAGQDLRSSDDTSSMEDRKWTGHRLAVAIGMSTVQAYQRRQAGRQARQDLRSSEGTSSMEDRGRLAARS